MPNKINTLFKKGFLKGDELGKLIILNQITSLQTFIERKVVEQLYTEEGVSLALNKLNREEYEVYDKYVNICNILMTYFTINESLDQQIRHFYYKMSLSMGSILRDLIYKRFKMEEPIIMTRPQYNRFIEEETKKVIERKYSYIDIIHKALNYYLNINDKSNQIADEINKLAERQLDTPELIELYNTVKYIGKKYILGAEITADNASQLMEIAENTIRLFKEQNKHINTDMYFNIKVLQGVLRDYQTDDNKKDISESFFLDEIIEVQRYIEKSEITIDIEIDKSNTSQATQLDILRSYFKPDDYVEKVGSLKDYYKLLINNFPKLFELLNKEISKHKGLARLKGISLDDFENKQINSEEYFTIYSESQNLEKEILLSIRRNNNRDIAIIQEDLTYDIGREQYETQDLYEAVYAEKEDIQRLRNNLAESRETLLETIIQMRAIQYFCRTLGNWLELDLSIFYTKAEGTNQFIDDINDLVISIDTKCDDDRDRELFFNLMPLITKKEQELHIENEKELIRWLTNLDNYTRTTDTNPLKKILATSKLKNMVGNDDR